jgi:hypothetical protein
MVTPETLRGETSALELRQYGFTIRSEADYRSR